MRAARADPPAALLAATELACAAHRLPRGYVRGLRCIDQRESGEGRRGRDAAGFARRRSPSTAGQSATADRRAGGGGPPAPAFAALLATGARLEVHPSVLG
jgi:hypothetical protein